MKATEIIKYLKNSISEKNNYSYSLPNETTKATIKCIKNQQAEIDRLNNIIKIMEKYLELIIDLGYDYDGLSEDESLKSLINELVRFASLGRAYNTTEPIYVNDNKKYNILHEELKEGK